MIECFKKAEIFDLIDSFTFSYSLRIGKPSKEIFNVALNKMKISANEAIMVGDNLNSDVKPAQELGMTTVLFNRNHHNVYYEVIHDFIVSDLSDLPKLLSKKS